jgi:hypothetical protein
MTSGVIQPKGPQAGDSPPAADGIQAGGSPGASAGQQRRRRTSGAVLCLIIAGALLVLGFSPASRLAANGLPRAPGSQVLVVTGRSTGRPRPFGQSRRGCPTGPASGRLLTSSHMPSRRWGSLMLSR